MPTSKPKVYGVAEITRRIKQCLEDGIGSIWVEGEISNLRTPASGHSYFTLKDEHAQISAVLFRGSQRNVKFTPGDGMHVRAFGDVSVYERSGNYQIIVRQMEEAGIGNLQAKFEELKEKLAKEGLFDEARKKVLPLLPQRLGVVTSATGAAIRDILNVVSRRFPNLHIVVAPAKVQGEGAAEEVAASIDALNRLGGLDVLIVGRGGGSIEDLWCFNEEIVARAIARSELPVISAVGHEIDFTIADFVADVRAPTPSAAAELVVGRKDAFEDQLGNLSYRLAQSLQGRVLSARNRLLRVMGHSAFKEPGGLVRQYMQELDGLSLRMEHAAKGGVVAGRQQLRDWGLRTGHVLQLRCRSVSEELKRYSTQLRALNPLAVLGRGYSVTVNDKQQIVSRASQVKKGERLVTRLAEGEIDSDVVGVRDG